MSETFDDLFGTIPGGAGEETTPTPGGHPASRGVAATARAPVPERNFLGETTSNRLSRQELTHPALLERLSYDPDTGTFTWLRNDAGRRGLEAGCLDSDGYRVIQLLGYNYAAHRLAWFFTTGSWPPGVVDHCDGVRDNNRMSNLRNATYAENAQHKLHPSGDTPGACYRPGQHAGKPWRARIKASRKVYELGYFSTPEEASAAYLAAKKSLHPFSPVPRTAE